jgi:hypothetical protein
MFKESLSKPSSRNKENSRPVTVIITLLTLLMITFAPTFNQIFLFTFTFPFILNSKILFFGKFSLILISLLIFSLNPIKLLNAGI